MHDHGVPARADWPAGVLGAVAAFRQGDVVADLPLFYLASIDTPVHARSRAYAEHGVTGDELVEFDAPAPYGLVTTQTCDLAQEGDAKPTSAWVQLAPVFNAEAPHPVLEGKRLLDGAARKLVREGRIQHLLWVPDIVDDGLWFADLTFEIPVERGWLARQPRIEGFTGESAREEVGRRLAWLRSRPAFDTRFVRAVQEPVVRALRQLRKNDPEVYDRMHAQVAELGVALTGRLVVGQAELVVLHGGLDADLAEWWHNLWDELYANAGDEGFNLLPLRIVDLGAITARDYRALTRLPLAAVSPNPAWYGVDPENLPT